MTQVSGVNCSVLSLYDDPAVGLRNGERFLILGSSPGWVLEAQLDVAKMPRSSSTPICRGLSSPPTAWRRALTNKVAHMIAKAFVELGVETLRFNF